MGDKPSPADAPAQFEATRRRSFSDVVSENDDKVVKDTTPTSEKDAVILEKPPLEARDTDEPSIHTRNSTDDEATLMLEDGIPAEIPLETLAGPGLVTTYTEDFDWGGADEEDDDKREKDEKGGRSIVLCLSRNSSYVAWASIILFGLLFIGVDIAVFVVYDGRESMVSYNLQLWFTWLSIMWFIGLVLQLIVELVPWAIKRIVGILRPQSTEVLRMRLSYYMALRLYIKLLFNSAWNWGSWALIMQMIYIPPGNEIPRYVHVFYSIWECVFFLALLLFIEKFILQLIVTSFHKKAYSDRISENDKALKILDRLKKVRRRNPQEHLLKRIRRSKQNKQSASSTPTPPTRSMSADDGVPAAYQQQQQQQQQAGTPDTNATRSIMRSTSPAPDEASTRANVHFPSQNMDTLIAIPPLEERDKTVTDDEKIVAHEEQEPPKSQNPPPSSDFVSNLTKRLRDVKKNKQTKQQQQDKNTPPKTTESPPPLTRSSTWMTWRSGSDEKSFLNGARDFGISTTAIPGKLIKGGYNKIRSAGSSQQTTLQGGTSRQAKALAKRIYHNLVGGSGRDTIVEADLVPFFRTPEEVSEAFKLFDRDGNGTISKQELRSACIRIYRERKNLARSMRDLSQATGKLDIIFMVIFAVIWVVIVCAAFGVDVGTQLMPLWSAFIAASFIFGASAKDAFESIIFVFVTHPFDAGDRVFIGPENLVVQNVGLYVSTFVKWDGSIMYIKNSVLATAYITNVRRTGPTGETVDLNVDFSTPTWKMLDLRDHMTEWCNQFPNLYRPNSNAMNIITYENQNRITLTFYFEHTQNWQDLGGRWLRHNNYMIELKEHSERLGIQYHLPSQPFQSSENKEGPKEIYNMGSKSSFGQEGMRLRRSAETGGYREDDDGAATRGVPFGG